MTTTNFNTEEVSKSSEESMNPETKKVKIKDKSIVRRKIVVSRLKRRILKHVWLVRAGIILGSLAGLVLVFGMILFFLRKTPLNIYITLASDFMFTPEEKMEQIEGKTNIIILGKGGQNQRPHRIPGCFLLFPSGG